MNEHEYLAKTLLQNSKIAQAAQKMAQNYETYKTKSAQLKAEADAARKSAMVETKKDQQAISEELAALGLAGDLKNPPRSGYAERALQEREQAGRAQTAAITADESAKRMEIEDDTYDKISSASASLEKAISKALSSSFGSGEKKEKETEYYGNKRAFSVDGTMQYLYIDSIGWVAPDEVQKLLTRGTIKKVYNDDGSYGYRKK